ncbi:MAG: DMT family transporter [Dehalococcoidia bacterium]
MDDKGWLPYAALGVGVFAISWSAILIREAPAPALVIACLRMVFAGAPMGALAFVQHRRAPQTIPMSTVGPMVLSAAFLAAHFAFWVTSLEHTSVATSVVLVAAQPLYVAAASPFVLGERIEGRVWVAIGVALAGALMMASEDIGDGLGTLAGDAYAALGGAAAAGYFMIGRRVRPSVPWLRYVGTVYPLCAAMLIAVALIGGESFGGHPGKAYLLIAILAIGPQLIGHSSINWTLAVLPAVVVSIAILMEPVITTGLATFILDEYPSVIEVLGGTLVLAGVYLALRPERERRLAAEISSAD